VKFVKHKREAWNEETRSKKKIDEELLFSPDGSGTVTPTLEDEDQLVDSSLRLSESELNRMSKLEKDSFEEMKTGRESGRKSKKKNDPHAKKRKEFKRLLRRLESECREEKSQTNLLRKIESDTLASKTIFPVIPKSLSEQYVTTYKSMVRTNF